MIFNISAQQLSGAVVMVLIVFAHDRNCVVVGRILQDTNGHKFLRTLFANFLFGLYLIFVLKTLISVTEFLAQAEYRGVPITISDSVFLDVIRQRGAVMPVDGGVLIYDAGKVYFQSYAGTDWRSYRRQHPDMQVY